METFSSPFTVIIQIKDHKNTSPLTVNPPTIIGLAEALENKYNIQANLVEQIYRQSSKGFLVAMDDELIRHFGNKGEFKLDVATTDESKYRVTLIAAKWASLHGPRQLSGPFTVIFILCALYAVHLCFSSWP